MVKEAIKGLKEVRVMSDAIMHQIKEEFPAAGEGNYIREVSLAYTALQKGRMYLGECQHDLGAEYPYKKTAEATKPSEIEMGADLCEGYNSLEGNNIENLIKLRGYIDKVTAMALDSYSKGRNNYDVESKFIADCHLSEAYRSLKEARMWLGCALGIIRDSETSN
ncbi:MAG: hypothetical protein CMC35_02770 [Flavobacteriaceae bacterium]|nr:hypothetical protein [Flavobacteriaceae bacterium]|tara:strand:+ start:1310 stop:1804 length:495 start_codon:yes stop_codon:yes gene_type:complete